MEMLPLTKHLHSSGNSPIHQYIGNIQNIPDSELKRRTKPCLGDSHNRIGETTLTKGEKPCVYRQKLARVGLERLQKKHSKGVGEIQHLVGISFNAGISRI